MVAKCWLCASVFCTQCENERRGYLEIEVEEVMIQWVCVMMLQCIQYLNWKTFHVRQMISFLCLEKCVVKTSVVHLSSLMVNI